MIHRGYGLGYGGGLLLLLLVLMVLLGLALLLAVVLLPRRSAAPVATAPLQAPALAAAPSPARVIIDERLARGEISVEEYQQLRAALEGPPP
jgi:putative membrane protein